MKLSREDLTLYAVTDRHWLNGSTLTKQVEDALKGGATFIQLREKNLNDESFYKEAVEIKDLCGRYNVPFVINDNVDIALKMDADGVHVGQDDMAASDIRKLLGPDKIIGVSAHNLQEAIKAQEDGADYLGVGAVFATSSKDDVSVLSHEILRDICNAVDIPVIAIGGITKDNIIELKGSGIDGIAVISAIFAKDDITAATQDLKEKVLEIL